MIHHSVLEEKHLNHKGKLCHLCPRSNTVKLMYCFPTTNLLTHKYSYLCVKRCVIMAADPT